MATSTIFLIVHVAVAAVLLIIGFVWVARTKRNQYRHVEADKVRGAAKAKRPTSAGSMHWQRRPPPRPAPRRPKPTSRRPKPPVCNSKPPPTVTRQRPPVTNSTTSETARTRWRSGLTGTRHAEVGRHDEPQHH